MKKFGYVGQGYPHIYVRCRILLIRVGSLISNKVTMLDDLKDILYHHDMKQERGIVSWLRKNALQIWHTSLFSLCVLGK
jgi:hypothetical protein